jgi:hypothetical protein
VDNLIFVERKPPATTSNPFTSPEPTFDAGEILQRIATVKGENLKRLDDDLDILKAYLKTQHAPRGSRGPRRTDSRAACGMEESFRRDEEAAGGVVSQARTQLRWHTIKVACPHNNASEPMNTLKLTTLIRSRWLTPTLLVHAGI